MWYLIAFGYFIILAYLFAIALGKAAKRGDEIRGIDPNNTYTVINYESS